MRDLADVALKYLSHEDNETITDPLGTAWWDSASGNENGDNCNSYGASVDPSHGPNPNAFLPALGGSAPAGTLFDQLINGDRYYVQSEWSNGDANCEMAPIRARSRRASRCPPHPCRRRRVSRSIRPPSTSTLATPA